LPSTEPISLNRAYFAISRIMNPYTVGIPWPVNPVIQPFMETNSHAINKMETGARAAIRPLIGSIYHSTMALPTFPLTGKHKDLDCSACHKSKVEITQYENTSSTCHDCHNDVHGKQFDGKACQDCHSTQKWPIPEFDHFKLTKFPLDGQHENLACGQCHKFDSDLTTIRFKPIPHKCQDCHSFGDFKR
jgi:Phosphotransferase system cellobiose-specific component IIC